MRKISKLVAAFGVVASMAVGSFASADVISGFNFDESTITGIDNSDGTTPAELVGSGETGTLQGVFGSDNYADASMTLADGDVLEFDYAYTLAGFGTDNWGGTGYVHLLDAADATLVNVSTDQSKDISVDGNWGGNLASDDGTFHVTIEFTGGDAVWSVAGADGTSSTAWNGTQAGVDPTAVDAIRLGINNSRRTAVISNIAINATAVPEPGSLALLGLAGLGMIARRRRS